MLQMTQASIQLSSTDKATRLAAVRALAESNMSSTKTLLLGVLEQKSGQFVEPDAEVRSEAEKSLYCGAEPAVRQAKWSAAYSAAFRSAASCCSRRSGWRSPTA